MHRAKSGQSSKDSRLVSLLSLVKTLLMSHLAGFRIELGEIDSHLSKHPLIRENVTLVRRDKDEEPNLVSYFVVDQAKWPKWLEAKGLPDDVEDDTMVGMLQRYRTLRDDARSWLKQKLPVYAVPNVRCYPRSNAFCLVVTNNLVGIYSIESHARDSQLQNRPKSPSIS